MEKIKIKLVPVDEEFIKKAYNAACSTWKELIKKECPSVNFGEHKRGNRYLHNPSKATYLLAEVNNNNQMMLLNLESGTLWSFPLVAVANCKDITDEEFKEICADCDRDFTKIC